MQYRQQLSLMFRAGIAAALAILSCSAVPAAQSPPSRAAQPSGPGSLAGVWVMTGYVGSKGNSARERVQRTVDSKWPPLQPWAEELLAKRIRMSDEGAPFGNTLTRCLPGGVPQMMFGAPYPVQILETPGQLTMLFEEQNHFRIVHLNGKHPEDPDPAYMGHSVGRWQGDTLVVETVGLTEDTTIDQVGMPHSEELRVIERYRRVDANTFEVLVTLSDPKTFTRSWDAKAIYRLSPPGTQVSEYICENNRNAPDEEGRATFR